MRPDKNKHHFEYPILRPVISHYDPVRGPNFFVLTRKSGPSPLDQGFQIGAVNSDWSNKMSINSKKSPGTLSYYITRVFEPVPKYFFVSLKSLRSFASRNASWSISFLSAVFRYFSFLPIVFSFL